MAENVKFCIYCGARNPLESQFCTSCGKKFIDEPMIAAPVQNGIPPISPTPVQNGMPPIPPVPSGVSGIFTLSCPTCGASLQITPQINRFTCTFCGNEHLVRRGDGYATLEPVLQAVQAVHQDVNRIQQSGNAIMHQAVTTARSAQEAQSAANLMAQRGAIMQQISLLDRSLEDKKAELLAFRKKDGAVFIGLGLGLLISVVIFGFLAEVIDETLALVLQLMFGITGGILFFIGLVEAIALSSKKAQSNALKQEIASLEAQIAQLRQQLH